MKIPEKLQLLFTVLEQRAAECGLPMQVTYNDKEGYVVDFFLNFGVQRFRLHWNVNDKSELWPDGSIGWSEHIGF
jgi:hypothetical protein